MRTQSQCDSVVQCVALCVSNHKVVGSIPTVLVKFCKSGKLLETEKLMKTCGVSVRLWLSVLDRRFRF